MHLLQFPHAPAPRAAASAGSLPAAPQTLEDTGLSTGFLTDLLAKTLLQGGTGRLVELGTRLCLGGALVDTLCQAMRRDGLLEVTRRGQNEADVEFELTLAGRARALDAFSRSAYLGPAPVPAEAYAARVQAQAADRHPVTLRGARAAFAGVVLADELVDRLGTAMNAARPMLLHGPAGSGKTYIARGLARLLPGPVAVPHAISVQDEVIRVFDPLCHRPVSADPGTSATRGGLDSRQRADARWMLCERPVVACGGELTLEMLDLGFDPRAGYYEAPPHLKANNGLFIVDDLGRQRVTPRELMNRWIVPMERRHDHLTLRQGARFTVPFELMLVFSSNLSPRDLDDAFLRRIGHKIEVGPVDAPAYARIFEDACADEGVPFDAAGLAHLLERLHPRHGRPLLACHPRDLLRLVASRARYLEVEPTLDAGLLDWAWRTHFGDAAPAAGAAASATADPSRRQP